MTDSSKDSHLPADYDELQVLQETLETIAGIQEGLDSMKAGKGRPAEDVFKDLEKKYKFLSNK